MSTGHVIWTAWHRVFRRWAFNQACAVDLTLLLCSLLCPQPLEMNLVELAQHNFSDAPRYWPPLRGKQQQNKIAPWAAAVALMRRRRRRNRDPRPKLWHLLILFSCGVEATPRCLLLRLSCLCLFGGMDVRGQESHGYFSDFCHIFYLSVSPVCPSVLHLKKNSLEFYYFIGLALRGCFELLFYYHHYHFYHCYDHFYDCFMMM